MRKICCSLSFFSLCLLFLASCGYHIGTSCSPALYRTVSVPYVCNDTYGDFTAAFIKEITLNGNLEYKDSGADLHLCVELLEIRDENIGFRYDRNKRGKLTDSIIPTETRVCQVAEFTLYSSSTNCALIGPVQVKASVDYDHDYYSTRDGVNVFSLGQLTDYEEARDVAVRPLYRKLAKKIVEYIYESW